MHKPGHMKNTYKENICVDLERCPSRVSNRKEAILICSVVSSIVVSSTGSEA